MSNEGNLFDYKLRFEFIICIFERMFFTVFYILFENMSRKIYQHTMVSNDL